MKFKQFEDLKLDLVKTAEKENTTRYYLDELFIKNNFKPKRTVSGTAYEVITDNINASFFINDKASYKGYITTKDETTQYSGKIETIVKVAKQFIEQVNELR